MQYSNRYRRESPEREPSRLAQQLGEARMNPQDQHDAAMIDQIGDLRLFSEHGTDVETIA